MSNEILAQLLDTHAFDGSQLHVDMPALHLPFDDRGRTGTESGIVRAARTTERLGVKGPIGCGKTSVLRYTLDDPNGTIAPIWVSVAFDDDLVVLDVRRFAAHVIQSIVRDAQRAGTLSARDRDAILKAAAARRPLPGSERRLAAKLAAKFWVAHGELAGEVTSTLAGVDLQRPAGEVLESVNRALEAIAAAGRQPVIVTQLASNVAGATALSTAAIEMLAELNRVRAARNIGTTLGIAHAALVAAVDRIAGFARGR